MASKYEKQASKYLDPLEKEAQAENKKRWQEKAQDTRKIYDNEIFEAGRAYEDQYRDNAVQKAINERQVAESMANMGLTDSGLNRTQLTAINLSAANNKAAIDRARQQAMSNIELQKTSDLSTIRQGYLSDKATIKQNYDEAKANYASELYKNAVSAAKKSSNNNKTGAKNQGIIPSSNLLLSRNYKGNLEDNGVSWTTYEQNGVEYTKYTDGKTGKSSVFRSNVNPYTNTVNYDTSNGSWSNTKYQPTNITIATSNVKKNNGQVISKGDWIDDSKYVNSGNSENLKLEFYESTYVDNLERDQNVFKTESKINGTQYWMWDDAYNRYFEVYKNNKTGKWDLK